MTRTPSICARSLPCLLADSETQVNCLIIGHRIQGLAGLLQSLAAQKQQRGPLRRLGIGFERSYRLSGLVSCQRRITE